MFARRVQFDLRENSLTRLCEKKRRAGADIIDLTISNPTAVGLDYPESPILEALSLPESLLYEPTAQGLHKSRQAIAELYRRRGCDLSTRDILLTSGTSEAYSFLFKLLLDPGELVLLPRPSYPLFEFLARMESIKAQPYYLYYDDGWHYDLEGLETHLSGGARAMVLVNPNNPTGSLIQREEWIRLRELCLHHQVALICDEVFTDYLLEEQQPHVDPLFETEIPLFLLNGLSKNAGLPQVKLSWIVLRGPAEQKERSLNYLEMVSDTYLSVGTPVQHATPTLISISDGVRNQIKGRISANYQYLRRACSGKVVELLRSQGGWYATLRLPRSQSEEEWSLYLLNSENLLTHPGYFFDFPEEAYLVLSLLVESNRFEEGVKRLVRAIETY